MSLSSIRSWFAKGNRAQWCVFVLFVSCTFFKNVIFHYWIYQSILFSSIIEHPTIVFNFYLHKLCLPFFIGIFIFLSRRQWWTIAVSLVIDLWLVSNLLYYRANNIFVDFYSVFMASNLDGYTDAITTYMNWSICVPFVITFFYTLAIIPIMHNGKILPQKFTYLFIISFALLEAKYYGDCQRILRYNFTSDEFDFYVANGGGESDFCPDNRYGKYGWKCFIPFRTTIWETTHTTIKSYRYVEENSILTYFAKILIDFPIDKCKVPGTIPDKEIAHFLNTQLETPIPTSNLIVILVESLESWPLKLTNINQQICPNLSNLISSENILYAPYIQSQVKHGVSGDGQFILLTGMLPIQKGSITSLYHKQFYPSFCHLFTTCATFAPNNCWNQQDMNQCYGITNLIIPDGVDPVQDEHLFTEAQNYFCTSSTKPIMIQIITVSTHSPFNRISMHHPHTDNEPEYLQKYLNCLQYMDSCFGCFWNSFINSSLASSTTVIITGDHTIFKDMMLKDFARHSSIISENITDGQNFCPLIIYSPAIEGNVQVTDTCYQMDIYPTIMHLIDCEDYYWKGFGVNLLDSVARHNRPISEQEAYRLSDLMIRSNYFEQYK